MIVDDAGANNDPSQDEGEEMDQGSNPESNEEEDDDDLDEDDDNEQAM